MEIETRTFQMEFPRFFTFPHIIHIKKKARTSKARVFFILIPFCKI